MRKNMNAVWAAIIMSLAVSTAAHSITIEELQAKLVQTDWRATFSDSDFQATLKFVSIDP